MKIISKIIGALLFSIQTLKAQNTNVTTIETFAKVPFAVGNIAYTYNGTLVYSNQPFYSPSIRVMQYDEQTKTAFAFPNMEWNTEKKESTNYLSSVLGIRNDSEGIVVWMLDMGIRNNITPKFVGWNTKENKLHKIIEIPAPARLPSSQLNDFVIDEINQVFVIADEQIGPNGDGTKAALVIVDMKSGKCRRILEGHYSTVPENIPIIINKQILHIPNTSQPLLVGVDGITLDKENNWLYYSPINGTKVYRIKMMYLLDETLTDKQLGLKVEAYSNKEKNGGITIDIDGNLYLTNIETNSIGIINAKTRKPTIYATNKNLLWPDGVSSNKDGYMYAAASQLHLAAVFNNGIDHTTGEFFIYRFKPLAQGIFGR